MLAVAAARSVALGGFGLDSLIEVGASTVVLWELSGSGEEPERRALRLIGGAFVALAAYLNVQSLLVLVTGYRPGLAGLAGARGHLAGALTEAERLAARQCKHPAAAAAAATATPAVTTCGDPSRPPRRRLIAYATNASAPAMQTDSGHFGNNTGRIATNSENSPLTGTIQ